MNEIHPPALSGLPFDWSTTSMSGTAGKSPEAIRAAAEQFEALLVGQMLRSLREAGGGGWLGGSEQDAAFSLMEMAEQCLASALAAQGGLGLARLAEESLSKQSQPTRATGEEEGRAANRERDGSCWKADSPANRAHLSTRHARRGPG